MKPRLRTNPGLAPGTYQVGLAALFSSGVPAAGLRAGNGSASALVFQSR